MDPEQKNKKKDDQASWNIFPKDWRNGCAETSPPKKKNSEKIVKKKDGRRLVEKSNDFSINLRGLACVPAAKGGGAGVERPGRTHTYVDLPVVDVTPRTSSWCPWLGVRCRPWTSRCRPWTVRGQTELAACEGTRAPLLRGEGCCGRWRGQGGWWWRRGRRSWGWCWATIT